MRCRGRALLPQAARRLARQARRRAGGARRGASHGHAGSGCRMSPRFPADDYTPPAEPTESLPLFAETPDAPVEPAIGDVVARPPNMNHPLGLLGDAFRPLDEAEAVLRPDPDQNKP